MRKVDSAGRVWGSPISGPRGTPNRDIRNTCFCRRRLSPGHFPEAGGQVQGPEGPDLNGSCREEGWDPQGSGGAERQQREALKPAPHQGALQCPHMLCGHRDGMQGHPSRALPGSILCVPKERGKPMMTTSPKHASLESVALGVFTDRNQGAEQHPSPASTVPVPWDHRKRGTHGPRESGLSALLKPWLTLTRVGKRWVRRLEHRGEKQHFKTVQHETRKLLRERRLLTIRR